MSSRLRSGQLAQGYTNAMAVAAVNDYRGYGQASTRDVIVTSVTPASWLLATTQVLVAGKYVLRISSAVSGSNSGTKVGVALEVDGQDYGFDFLSEAIVVDGLFIVSATPEVDFTASDGAHTFEFFVWQPNSPGSLTTRISEFAWERVA